MGGAVGACHAQAAEGNPPYARKLTAPSHPNPPCAAALKVAGVPTAKLDALIDFPPRDSSVGRTPQSCRPQSSTRGRTGGDEFNSPGDHVIPPPEGMGSLMGMASTIDVQMRWGQVLWLTAWSACCCAWQLR